MFWRIDGFRWRFRPVVLQSFPERGSAEKGDGMRRAKLQWYFDYREAFQELESARVRLSHGSI